MEEKAKQSKSNYIIVVLAGITTQIVVALTFNCSGVFMSYVVKSLNVSISALSLYLTIAATVMMLLTPLCGRFIEKYHVKILGSVCVCVLFAMFMVISNATNVFVFYVCGFCIGVVMTFIAYMFVPTIIARWFKKKVGFFTGLCMAFSSVIAIFANPLVSMLIQANGWPFAYRTIGIICLVICLPFMLLVKDRPSDVGMLRYGETAEDLQNDTVVEEAKSGDANEGMSAGKAMKTGVFYILCVFALLLGIICGMWQLLPTFASNLPISESIPTVGSLLASAVMLAATIGQFGLGALSDKSITLALFIAGVCGIIGMLMMWFLNGSAVTLIIGAFLYGILFASAPVEVPLVTRCIFGLRDYARIFSRVMVFRAFGAAVGVSLCSLVLQYLGYSGLFGIGAVSAVIIFMTGLVSMRAGKKLVWDSPEDIQADEKAESTKANAI